MLGGVVIDDDNAHGVTDGNHALLIGLIQGMCMAYKDKMPGVFETEIISNSKGELTNEIRIRRPSGTYVLVVWPEDIQQS